MESRIRQYFTYLSGDPVTRNNIWNNLWDGAWFNVMMGLTNSFLGVYALALGASDSMLGWLTSLPALIALSAQIPGAVITSRYQERLKVSIPYAFVHRLSYLGFVVIPFLPIAPVHRGWLFIGLLALAAFPATVGNVAWSAMMGEIFPQALRGRIFGDRNMLLGLVSVVFTLLAGLWLDKVVYPYNFATLFLASFLALMVSLSYQRRLQERTGESPVSIESKQKNPAWHWESLGRVLGDRRFRIFAFALFVVYLGLNVSAAMWTILYVRVLGLSKSFIGILAVVSQLTAVLSYRPWAALADRKGSEYALFICIAGFVPVPLLYVFARTEWALILLSVLGGLTSAGLNLVLFNALLDRTGDVSLRPSYIAVFHTLIGLTGFIAPIAGIAIYRARSMALVFVVSAVLRLAGLILMPRKATESDAISTTKHH